MKRLFKRLSAKTLAQILDGVQFIVLKGGYTWTVTVETEKLTRGMTPSKNSMK